jgi:Txe/YoeB family toxin of Txe-Axe toxin-antitoxin module
MTAGVMVMPQRWTAKKKAEIVLQIIKGKSCKGRTPYETLTEGVLSTQSRLVQFKHAISYIK